MGIVQAKMQAAEREAAAAANQEQAEDDDIVVQDDEEQPARNANCPLTMQLVGLRAHVFVHLTCV